MRFPALHLIFGVAALALAAGCARPTLDDLEVVDDGGTPVIAQDAGEVPRTDTSMPEPTRDAATGTPSTTPDAGAPTPVVDAGPSCAADGDQDGVCDDTDNCPTTTNADQADADKDGRGDACPELAFKCTGADLPGGGIALGDGTVSGVALNGNGDSQANVEPGQKVTVTVTVTFDGCGAIYSNQSIFVGLDNSGATCKPFGCTQGLPLSIPFSFTFNAPTEPGLHYVLAGLNQSICINGMGSSGGGSAADTRIAALCVGEKK
jgi:hypothetical protein